MPTPPSDKVLSLLERKRAGDLLEALIEKRPATKMTVRINIDLLPADLLERLPPLPPIEDVAIEKRVFTHTSMAVISKTTVKFTQEKHTLEDNEKMEWVGDGILSSSKDIVQYSS